MNFMTCIFLSLRCTRDFTQRLRNLLLCDIQKLPDHGPGILLWVSLLEQGLSQKDPKVPSSLSYSVILCKYLKGTVFRETPTTSEIV